MSKLRTMKERFPQIYEWFTAHVAKRYEYDKKHPDDPSPPVRIRWARPDTGNYSVDYLFLENTLFINGDLGQAVYRWSSKITPEWVAKCDLAYFAEKMDAGGQGITHGRHWDSSKMKRWVAGHIEDKIQALCGDGYGLPEHPAALKDDPDRFDCTYEPGDYSAEERTVAVDKCRAVVTAELEAKAPLWEDNISSDHEWYAYLMDDNDRYEFFGEPEGEEGMDFHPRVAAHLIGLQMAVEQLKAKETVAA